MKGMEGKEGQGKACNGGDNDGWGRTLRNGEE